MWKSVGKAREWKHPRAPPDRLLFQEEKAAPAVLDFLRESKVGRITLASLEAGEKDMEEILVELRPRFVVFYL